MLLLQRLGPRAFACFGLGIGLMLAGGLHAAVGALLVGAIAPTQAPVGAVIALSLWAYWLSTRWHIVQWQIHQGETDARKLLEL